MKKRRLLKSQLFLPKLKRRGTRGKVRARPRPRLLRTLRPRDSHLFKRVRNRPLRRKDRRLLSQINKLVRERIRQLLTRRDKPRGSNSKSRDTSRSKPDSASKKLTTWDLRFKEEESRSPKKSGKLEPERTLSTITQLTVMKKNTFQKEDADKPRKKRKAKD